MREGTAQKTMTNHEIALQARAMLAARHPSLIHVSESRMVVKDFGGYVLTIAIEDMYSPEKPPSMQICLTRHLGRLYRRSDTDILDILNRTNDIGIHSVKMQGYYCQTLRKAIRLPVETAEYERILTICLGTAHAAYELLLEGGGSIAGYIEIPT